MSQLDELARELRTNYSTAAKGGQVLQIHLFGIRRAAALANVSLPELLARAGMSDTYKTERRKGMRLAPYVEVKTKA